MDCSVHARVRVVETAAALIGLYEGKDSANVRSRRSQRDFVQSSALGVGMGV
jgi:hypothetical protein